MIAWKIEDVAREVVVFAVGTAFGYLLFSSKFGPWGRMARRVNKSVRLQDKKIVDSFNVEELGETKAFCRCWRSKQFPYCDGSHTEHNLETGDNVGPVLVKRRT